jgi:hypothetical protein
MARCLGFRITLARKIGSIPEVALWRKISHHPGRQIVASCSRQFEGFKQAEIRTISTIIRRSKRATPLRFALHQHSHKNM